MGGQRGMNAAAEAAVLSGVLENLPAPAHLKISTCAGESDNGLQFMFGIPWLFDVYLTLEGVFKNGKERDWGMAIHNGAFWLYPEVGRTKATAKTRGGSTCTPTISRGITTGIRRRF